MAWIRVPEVPSPTQATTPVGRPTAADRRPVVSARIWSSSRPRRTSTPGGEGSGPWVHPRAPPAPLLTSKAPAQVLPLAPTARPLKTRPRLGMGAAFWADRTSDPDADADADAGWPGVNSTGARPAV